jgi:hypothetical protein
MGVCRIADDTNTIGWDTVDAAIKEIAHDSKEETLRSIFDWDVAPLLAKSI